jgi:hypothetical protein
MNNGIDIGKHKNQWFYRKKIPSVMSPVTIISSNQQVTDSVEPSNEPHVDHSILPRIISNSSLQHLLHLTIQTKSHPSNLHQHNSAVPERQVIQAMVRYASLPARNSGTPAPIHEPSKVQQSKNSIQLPWAAHRSTYMHPK